MGNTQASKIPQSDQNKSFSNYLCKSFNNFTKNNEPTSPKKPRIENLESNLIKYIYQRPSDIFIDEDELFGQEFYTEIKNKKSNIWTLKKIAKRHLRHVEFIKLDKPSLHYDCRFVLLPIIKKFP